MKLKRLWSVAKLLIVSSVEELSTNLTNKKKSDILYMAKWMFFHFIPPFFVFDGSE